jgi:monolysocardiolipin acyltransferase
MRRMNQLEFDGEERFEALFKNRERGLLTFSNHVSLFDDPLLTSNLGTTSYEDIRWIPADHQNFFGNRLKGLVFSAGKCVPIIRGGGLEQSGMSFLVERLRAGEWVHIFPEGGRTRREDETLTRPFKLGIGKIMAEATPVVMPFYHRGMGSILPIGARFPRRGQRVVVLFGEAVTLDEEWLKPMTERARDTEELWGALRDWSEARLVDLESALERRVGFFKDRP